MSYEAWGDGGEDSYYSDEQVAEAIEEATEELKAQLKAANEALVWYGTLKPIMGKDCDEYEERYHEAIDRAEANNQ